MRGLETGLTVGTIASSPIAKCDADMVPNDVLSRPEWLDFDVIPVATRGRVVAVIERKTGQLRPLDSGLLVSAVHPIQALLMEGSFIEDGYRLVLDGEGINGIVTVSDLLRLPARVLTFTLISHLESAMSSVIANQCASDDAWMTCLRPGRRDRINGRAEQLANRRLNPSKLELTDFSDKFSILQRLQVFTKQQADEAGGLEDLRNAIVHARDYLRDEDDVRKYIDRIRRIGSLTKVLVGYQPNRTSPPDQSRP